MALPTATNGLGFFEKAQWNNVSLYECALAEDPTCMVALKEEPAKTREIITTPMASYLRQSYLVYCWGKLKLNTPIGKRTFLAHFQRTQYRNYCALDGDRFDQTIPASFIKLIVAKLGSLNSEPPV
nr:RNA-dependent RNA polymerase [Molussus totiviridae 3]